MGKTGWFGAGLALVAAAGLGQGIGACGPTEGEVLSPRADTDAQAPRDGGPQADTWIPPAVKVGKIDLLFMIDNSGNMAGKQQVLATVVPDLFGRLANPLCVDAQGQPAAATSQPKSPDEPCPAGTQRELTPVTDMRVGVITSSIGGHGADLCSNGHQGTYNETMEDMSHLVTRGTKGKVATYQDLGFIAWDPKARANPPGESDWQKLVGSVGDIVLGAGEVGCGYEASLEAWYRFLVEPQPYQKMVVTGGLAVPEGVDTVVLAQRKAFLRQDSLVVVLMLTDEDDCSIVDGGQNFLAAQGFIGQTAFHLPRATSACASNPTSPSCMSCAQPGASGDPACASPTLDDQEDSLNLRCFRQKQRFGVDFLYPPSRYVDALTKPILTGGKVNPLFCNDPSPDGTSCNVPLRDPSQVLLAGIVGVPWQDLARDPKDLKKGNKTATEIQWDVVAGDVANYVNPKDPFMIDSIDPRAGSNPYTGESTAPPSSKSPTASSINGHEWEPQRRDLQYACIFKLAQPLVCGASPGSCDCYNGGEASKNPVCQKDDGTYDQTQRRAKAYPARRILTVLQGLGSRAVVGSVCAPNLTDDTADDYAYRPAVRALIDRIKPSLE
jgi:hypothetical protein